MRSGLIVVLLMLYGIIGIFWLGLFIKFDEVQHRKTGVCNILITVVWPIYLLLFVCLLVFCIGSHIGEEMATYKNKKDGGRKDG